jgi:serine/threonine protein kinase
MAVADSQSSNSRVPADHDEAAHDQIGSGASTPPGGTATPRPDLHNDKRVPALPNHNYFVQVRDFSSLPQSVSAPAPSLSAPQATSTMALPEQRSQESKSSSPPAATSRIEDQICETPPLLPHEMPPSDVPTQAALPTPPNSKDPSLHMTSNENSRTPSMTERSPTQEEPLEAARQSTCPRPKPPMPLRRDTISDALSSIVTRPDVSAHISNPSADPSASVDSSFTAPRSPDNTTPEVSKLTEDAERRDQNTPPLTPRSGSHESRRGEDAAALTAKAARSASDSTQEVVVALQKGQLDIVVEEGRGLRPSVQPYVVCVFQQSEDVSSGAAKEDEMDTAVDGNHASQSGEENLARGVAMRRIGSGSGSSRPIPAMPSRQTSSTNIADLQRGNKDQTTNPSWKHTARFDVVGEQNELDISVYDNVNDEAFLGHVRIPINLEDYEHQHEGWYKLQGDDQHTGLITGEVHVRIAFHGTGKKSFGPEDFEVLKLIGKGTFGQVFQVRKKDTKRIYAMKVLSKKVIVQKKEIQHTIGERNILVRTASTESPFIVGLKFSFQTTADLYLVTDYMSGGELFWHLQKEGRFLEVRAKFYIAELILALRHLHQHDIVYRDLKPENILLDANGHIALCDFGLSKANLAKDDVTNTFCGTTEYLAPEVLLDEAGYTKMVDFWSLGVLVFEMCCGWSPFYAEDTQQMYKNIAFGKVRFPRDALSNEGRNFVKGLLNRNPAHRLGAKGDAEELMAHPFFSDVDWQRLSKKMVSPPFKPKLKGELDTSNFDPEFTNALSDGNASSLNARAAALASGVDTNSTPLSPTMQNQFKGFTFVDESTLEQQFADRTDLDSPTEEKSAFGGSKNGDRMSGVESTHNDGDFNHGMLEDI